MLIRHAGFCMVCVQPVFKFKIGDCARVQLRSMLRSILSGLFHCCVRKNVMRHVQLRVSMTFPARPQHQ